MNEDVSPHRRNNFSLDGARAVYVPSSRYIYMVTNGLFLVEGEAARINSLDLEPIVRNFGDVPAESLAEALRTGTLQRIQLWHPKLVNGYDSGGVPLGVYLIEGFDASLKVVPAVHASFSDQKEKPSLEALTRRFRTIDGIVVTEIPLVPGLPAEPSVRYVVIAKDYNRKLAAGNRKSIDELALAQPI